MPAPTLTGKKLELRRGCGAYPLFVTSDKVTRAIIDKFLFKEFKLNQVDKTHPDAINANFYLVTDKSLPDPKTLSESEGGHRSITAPVKTLSVPPTARFTSPYIGASVEDVLEVCRTHFSGSPFAGRLFMVFDERSARDGDTVLLIEDVEPFPKRYPETTYLRARAEFGYASWSMGRSLAETGFLTEDLDTPEWADRESETGDDREEVFFGEKNMEVKFVCLIVTGEDPDEE